MVAHYCRVCKSEASEIIYDGPIRGGGVGSKTVDGYTIHRCKHCEFVFLYPTPKNMSEFYETSKYRKKFFNDTDPTVNQFEQDHEQNARINRIGVENIRNKIVADYGSGPGLFLDTIVGVAKQTIAIEPAQIYNNHLTSSGHTYYSYGNELLKDGIKIDIAVCFDTIEHILNLQEFIKQIFEAIIDGGFFYLSMPNFMDINKLLLPESYEPFNYQIAHLNYFTHEVAKSILESVGFHSIMIGYLHKYSIDNLLQWAKVGKPGILDTVSVFDNSFNNIFKSEIERLGVASHLFITAKK